MSFRHTPNQLPHSYLPDIEIPSSTSPRVPSLGYVPKLHPQRERDYDLGVLSRLNKYNEQQKAAQKEWHSRANSRETQDYWRELNRRNLIEEAEDYGYTTDELKMAAPHAFKPIISEDSLESYRQPLLDSMIQGWFQSTIPKP